MVRIAAEAEILMHPAEYWEIRNTPEFLAIECEFLNNACKYIHEEQVCAQGRRQTQTVITKPDLSGVPQWVLRMGPEDGITFTDYVEFVYDHVDTPYVCKVKTVPSIMSDRCSILGCLKVIPSPDGRTCKQTIEIELAVNVFGAGSILEQVVGRGITEGYKKLPSMVEKWKSVASSENMWKLGGISAASAATITNQEEEWETKSNVSEDSEFYDADETETEIGEVTPATSVMDLSRESLPSSGEEEEGMDVITAQPSVIVLDEPSATIYDLSQTEQPVTCTVPKFAFSNLWS